MRIVSQMGLFRRKHKRPDDILDEIRLNIHLEAFKLEKKRKTTYVI